MLLDVGMKIRCSAPVYNITFNQARASAAEALAVVITPEERPLPSLLVIMQYVCISQSPQCAWFSPEGSGGL